MLVDLVNTKSSDDVTLSGIVLEPETPRQDLLVDAMVMIHGSGGNFYLSPSNPRAMKLRDMGIPTALFNTRGHDVIGGRAGSIRTGNAYEKLSETHLDVQAMVNFMVAKGYKRVGIWGSSLGAVRVILAQAKNQDPNVAAVISLAPLRFSHEYYAKCEMAEEHLKNYENAKALAGAGRGHEIMFLDFPNPGGYFSADVYLDRHCSEHYDITKAYTNQIDCPLLILTGSEEIHPRMINAGRDMAALCAGRENVTWIDLEGGDHGWHNKEEDLFRVVPEWLGIKEFAGAV
jgi:pimeloyl-ACP methyl ester carboxylesterase|tara:strand:- start:272 stop:1135 length:864 start_codon:yes stop_codon:yes gene_type:complete